MNDIEEKLTSSCVKTSDSLAESVSELNQKMTVIEQKLDNLKDYIDQKIDTPQINSYTIHYNKLSWIEARSDCLTRRMDLASINSMAERDHVLKHLNGACDGYWVAARQDSTTKVWSWVNDNKGIPIEMWSPEEPKGNSIYGYLRASRNFLLDDDNPDQCYICESSGQK